MAAVKISVKRLLHGCRLGIATWLASIELHHVRQQQVDDRKFIIKRRTLWARLLIPSGNLFLRLSGSRVTALPVKEWHRWEQVMRNSPADDFLKTNFSESLDPESLVSLLHPGRTLDAILRDENSTTDQMRHAISLAFDQLLLLHARKGSWRGIVRSEAQSAPEEVMQPLSHGDATVENVCVDLENESAAWFDFDMRHRTQLSAAERHADDVRAFLFSAAAVSPRERIQQMVEQCLEKIESDELRCALLAQLQVRKRPTTFELAQAPLNYSAFQHTRTTLINKLNQISQAG